MEDVHIGYCREVARSVARRYGVTAPPVDVKAIAVHEGLRVVRADLGALEGRMREDDDGWLIEVNSDRSLTSQRFSVGHELAHRKLGHHGCGTDAKQEREANLFAAELLMPLALLKKAMTKHRSLGDLAQLFQVSKEAMQIKLQEQGMLLQLTSFVRTSPHGRLRTRSSPPSPEAPGWRARPGPRHRSPQPVDRGLAPGIKQGLPVPGSAIRFQALLEGTNYKDAYWDIKERLQVPER